MTDDTSEIDERTRLNDEVSRAIESSKDGNIGFYVPIDHALTVLGEDLVFDISTAHLSRQLHFRVNTAAGLQRVCDYLTGSGDWQAHAMQITSTMIFEEVSEIAATGHLSRSSMPYRRFRQRLRQGRPMVRNQVVLDSAGLIEAYVGMTEKLVESIRRRGVERRAPQNLDTLQHAAISDVRPLVSEVMERNVGVGLGADGELFRVCAGNHRTAAAIALGIASMPVELCMIHTNFLSRMMTDGKLDGTAAIMDCVRYAERRYGQQQKREITRS
jgi:hypothetical protein